MELEIRESKFSKVSFGEIRNKLEKRVPGRISKNGLAQSIPDSLKNANIEGTSFEKNSSRIYKVFHIVKFIR